MQGGRQLLLGLIVMMAGCALFVPKETRYLHRAQGRATQEDVRQLLGAPKFTDKQAGETIWVYQVREQQTGSRVTAPGTWCDEYILTFDDRAVLQHWTHASYFHGGENMPTYCVPGGFKPSS
jgi:outer membrane protein assembly factor BamE (lipoprotein component of BamABCDE complex)